MTAPTASCGSTSWREQATCRHHDPGIFFPVGKIGRARAGIGQAKVVCASCPVRSQCLSSVLDTRQDHGIWGGCDEDERRVLRRRQRSYVS